MTRRRRNTTRAPRASTRAVAAEGRRRLEEKPSKRGGVRPPLSVKRPPAKHRDADEAARQDLLEGIRRIIRRRRLTQLAAGELLGIQRPKGSTLLRGND